MSEFSPPEYMAERQGTTLEAVTCVGSLEDRPSHPHLICFALLHLVENRNKNRNNLLFSAMFLRIFTPKPLSYGNELPVFAVLASPAEGYIYCVRKWNKGLSAEPEVVLRVNPDTPRSEERQLPCWCGKVPLHNDEPHMTVVL